MNELLRKLIGIVGHNGLLTGDDVRQRPVDWTGKGSCQAFAIVRPGSTQELSEVMELCHEAAQSVVTQGGMTGLVHGSDASSGELIVSLERMTQIETLDPVGATMIVQAGVPLQRVQEEAEQEKLMFPLDMGARGSCTIGGNIATNAGGIRVIRYGMMRRQVLGLEVVLADGTVISSMNRMLKNNAGYDLKQVFIGSEGTLGIVTRAVLHLQPMPKSENTALLGVPSFEVLTGLLGMMRKKLAGNLSAFEVMWQSLYRVIAIESGRHKPPLSADYPYYVVVESLGTHVERDRQQFEGAMEQAFEKGLIVDAVLAKSAAQREKIWAIREDLEGVLKVMSPIFGFDVSLPVVDMPAYVDGIEAELKKRWHESRCGVLGHLGDGNLHIMITAGRENPGIRREVERLVYEPLQALGGSISAEHGIGMEKRAYLGLSRTPEELRLMHLLKRTLDPKNILNPGRVFDV